MIDSRSYRDWFVSAFRKIIFKPSEFSVHLNPDSSVRRAVAFGTLCLGLGLLLQSIIDLYFLNAANVALADGILSPILSDSLANGEELIKVFKEQYPSLKIQRILLIAFSPIIAYLSIYLSSGGIFVLFSGLRWMPEKTSYEEVLQAVSYGQAAMLFCLVPILGPLLAPIWAVVSITSLIRKNKSLRLMPRFLGVFLIIMLIKLLGGSTLQMISQNIAETDILNSEVI